MRRRRDLRRRLVRQRCDAIPKACALTLIALILLPFTAPFPTYDLRDWLRGQSHDALPQDLKDRIEADDESALPTNSLLVSPVLSIIALRDDMRPSRPEAQPQPYAVLRL